MLLRTSLYLQLQAQWLKLSHVLSAYCLPEFALLLVSARDTEAS